MTISIIFWLVALAVAVGIGFLSFRQDKDDRYNWHIRPVPLTLLIVWVIAALVFVPCIGSVPAGYRGIVYQWGKITDRIVQEGLYIVKPIAGPVTLSQSAIGSLSFSRVDMLTKSASVDFVVGGILPTKGATCS